VSADPLAALLDELPAEPARPAAAGADQVERYALESLQRAGFDVTLVEREISKHAPAGASVRFDDAPVGGTPAALPLHIPRPEDNQEPPSDLPYLRALLRDYDADRPRSQQKRPGPSELGTPCQRELAYKIAEYKGAEITHHDTDELPWAALQGTMMHELMERALHWENGRHDGEPGYDPWDPEGKAWIDENIHGSSDAFRRVTVRDWKYTGPTQLKKLRAAKRRGDPPAKQVSQKYRVQLQIYGHARALAGYPVKWVRIVFLARSWDFDDCDEWTEEYRPDVAQWAIDRYYRLDELVADLNVAEHPERWEEVPASPSEDACHWCPFRRPGGPADATGCPGNTAEVAESSRARFERSITG
jgi:hypothetical protein